MRRGLCVLSLWMAGCATTGERRFPTVDELRKLEAEAPPSRLANQNVIDVEHWQLAQPLPAAIAVTAEPADAAWSGLLARAADGRRGLVYPSAELSCAARELGRFYLAQHSLPSESLQDFIVARCGGSAVEIATAWQEGDVPDGVTDQEVFARWRESTERIVGKAIAEGNLTAGIAFARDQKRAVVMVVTGRRLVDLEPAPMTPDASGKIVLRGTLLVAADRLDALFGVGRFGVRRCIADGSVALPRFAVECETDRGDPSTWIEIGAFPPGRILGRVVLRALLSPSGAASDQYEKSRLHDPPAEGSADLRQQILSEVNRARREASLAPVELAEQESDAAAKLAPHYFGALGGAEPETVADVVVLGLRAGWDVGSDVRYGQFTANLVRELDARALISATLERPSSREALLDPAVRKIAIGEIAAPDQKLLAAVFGTYALVDPADRERETARVLTRLIEERKRAGRQQPIAADSLRSAASHAAAALGRGGVSPRQALEAMLADAAQSSGQSVRGWIVEYDLPQGLRFPAEMLSAPALSLAMSVTTYRPRGEPWARYVAFFVTIDRPTTVASLMR